MSTYVCEYVLEGTECTISFDARSWDEAQKFADKQGWLLLCEFVESEVEYIFEPDERTIN